MSTSELPIGTRPPGGPSLTFPLNLHGPVSPTGTPPSWSIFAKKWPKIPKNGQKSEKWPKMHPPYHATCKGAVLGGKNGVFLGIHFRGLIKGGGRGGPPHKMDPERGSDLIRSDVSYKSSLPHCHFLVPLPGTPHDKESKRRKAP